VSTSRTLVGLAGVVIIGVLGLGTTAIVAAPAAHPAANGTTRIVSKPAANGDDNLRLISWSGRYWAVYPNGQRGPESVPMTNAARAVWVDGNGELHLQIVKIHGIWRSVELQSVDPVTYGRYRMINDTATANFADSVILGMFVYRPHATKYTNEIDIENSRFPHLLKAPNNAQFAIQPYYTEGNEYPYSVAPSYHPLLQQFTWLPAPIGGNNSSNRSVQFVTRVGSTPKAPLLARWSYHGYSVPVPQAAQGGPMYLYINLWLNKGQAPIGGTHSAVLRSLTFTPLGT
jgi:hypothetical protein